MSHPNTTINKGGNFSRRRFIRGAVAAGAATIGFPYIIPSSALGADGSVAPSNRITLGCIGVGNQGTNDLNAFLEDERVQVVAVCDVNEQTAGYWDGAVAGWAPAKRIVDQHYGKKSKKKEHKGGCRVFDDFRRLVERPEIDAVVISTPDHWHAIPVIWAARAGKDIYGQKPLSLTISEGRAMSNAIKKYERIFQTGSQQRSDPNFRHACELVRNGRIGKLQTVKCGLPGGRPDLAKTGDRKKPGRIPPGFNYQFWLGPAPYAAYAPARCHVNFRWIYDYSGGQVTDWGGHHIDIAQWGIGTENTGPVLIKNAKGVYPPDELWNTATEYYFECIYKNGVKLIVSDKEKMGVTFVGSTGSIFVTRGGFETDPKDLWESVIGLDEIHLYQSDNHYRNFIDCVVSRKETIAPCETAHRSITIAHLGNIAMKVGRDLKWNPETETIIGDDAASAQLAREYRDPWHLPT